MKHGILVLVAIAGLAACSPSRQRGVDDAKLLQTNLISRALDALDKEKGFVAIAGAVESDGTISEIPMQLANGKSERQDKIDALIYGCRVKGSKNIRACAVVIKSGPIPIEGINSDALWFTYDSRSLYTVDVAYPLSYDSKGKATLGRPVEKGGSGFIWGQGRFK